MINYDSRPETLRHSQRVGELMIELVKEALDRSTCHDRSKTEPPEVEVHCKARPVAALRADNERLSRRLAGRFEETEKLRAEVASLRQQLATCSCGTSPMTYEGPEPDCPVHGAVHAFNEASAEIASLRQQLDDARADVARLTELEHICRTVSVPADNVRTSLLSAAVAAVRVVVDPDYDDGFDDLAGAVRRLAADRDRLLDVYRAAEAWRDWWATLRPEGGMFAPENGLAAAVDRARRAGAPAEALLAAVDAYRAGAAWSPAKPGDTPGELVPGEGEASQPVEVCGTECARPTHEPNWDLDYLDFPTAWWIQEQGYGHTDGRCSAVQSNGAFLCDCGAVQADWKRLRAAYRAGTPAEAPDGERA